MGASEDHHSCLFHEELRMRRVSKALEGTEPSKRERNSPWILKGSLTGGERPAGRRELVCSGRLSGTFSTDPKGGPGVLSTPSMRVLSSDQESP